MFGFLRGSRCQKMYRQVYAECCQFQRQMFGLDSLAFLSYEAVFLYVLAVDARACAGPPESAVTCCRLRRRPSNWPDFDRGLARFCASFALLLASIKLDDDVRDDASLWARLARRRFRRRFQEARHYFAGLDAHCEQRVEGFITKHLHLEQAWQPNMSLDEYVRPTSEAFGYFFALCGERFFPTGSAAPTLAEIGRHVGAAIISYDSAVDLPRDRLRGRFNPLRTERHQQSALEYSARQLALAGWACVGEFGAQAVGAQVARQSFERVGDRQRHGRRPVDKAPPRLWRLRRGECDCFCDPSCCEGCAGGGPCEAADTNSVATACECCVCAPCECCWWERRDGRRKRDKAAADKPSSVVGMAGRTVGPLRPSGVVMIGEKKFPAQSEGAWIDADTEVTVVDEQPFGVIVRPR